MKAVRLFSTCFFSDLTQLLLIFYKDFVFASNNILFVKFVKNKLTYYNSLLSNETFDKSCFIKQVLFPRNPNLKFNTL